MPVKWIVLMSRRHQSNTSEYSLCQIAAVLMKSHNSSRLRFRTWGKPSRNRLLLTLISIRLCRTLAKQCTRSSLIRVGSNLPGLKKATLVPYSQLCNHSVKQWQLEHIQHLLSAFVRTVVLVVSLQDPTSQRWISSLSSNWCKTRRPRRSACVYTRRVPASTIWTLSASSITQRTTGPVFTHTQNSWASTTGRMTLFTQTNRGRWKSRKWYSPDTVKYNSISRSWRNKRQQIKVYSSL